MRDDYRAFQLLMLQPFYFPCMIFSDVFRSYVVAVLSLWSIVQRKGFIYWMCSHGHSYERNAINYGSSLIKAYHSNFLTYYSKPDLGSGITGSIILVVSHNQNYVSVYRLQEVEGVVVCRRLRQSADVACNYQGVRN